MNSADIRDTLMRESWKLEPGTPRHRRLRIAISGLERRIVRDCDHDHDRHGVCRYCGHELDEPNYEYLRD